MTNGSSLSRVGPRVSRALFEAGGGGTNGGRS
jgi:hypothetical protein